ncbi:MAG: TraR/DksA C4-type zinc finger protein [Myxococcaceae bacterium]|nr:TraR/DksA C4-type zinc finger protein [Myxococcaceae bacterium]MCA3015422.1 TraR/DksA C4-type zinc finger protein [Myxococcaceae bacterium]
MTPAQRTALEARLRALLQDLAAKQARAIEPSRSDDLDTKVDEDQQPLTEMGQAIASNLNRADAALAARARRALSRLRDDPDDFGNCLDCGDEVPFARLKALPYAEYCIDCQGKRDGRGRATRSKLTDFS